MDGDKNSEDGKISLILPHGIRNAVSHKNVDKNDIRILWDEVLSSRPVSGAHPRNDKKPRSKNGGPSGTRPFGAVAFFYFFEGRSDAEIFRGGLFFHQKSDKPLANSL